MNDQMPEEQFLAPTRAAEADPDPITPSDEDLPTPELEGMTDAADDDSLAGELDDADPVADDDIAAALDVAGEEPV